MIEHKNNFNQNGATSVQHTTHAQNGTANVSFPQEFENTLANIRNDESVLSHFEHWQRRKTYWSQYKASKYYEDASRSQVEGVRLKIESDRLESALRVAGRYLYLLFRDHLNEDRELLFELYHSLIIGDANEDVWDVPRSQLDRLFEYNYVKAIDELETRTNDGHLYPKFFFREYDEVFTNTSCILTQHNTGRAGVYQNAINLLAGGGGIGKSTIAIELAVARCIGKSWYGFDVQQGQTIYVSSQDTSDRVKSRIEASAKELNVDLDAVRQNLLVTTPDDPNPSFQLLQKHEISDECYRVVENIQKNYTGALVIIDYLSGMQSRYGYHQEATHYQLVVQALQMLCKQNPVLVVCHTNAKDRKCNAELSQDSVRGCVELVDGARSCFVLGETSSGRRLVHVKSSYDELCNTQMLTKLNDENDFE